MRRPEEERLEKLLFIDRILTVAVAVVLLAFLFFAVKYIMVAAAVVKKAGVEDKNVLQILSAVSMEIYKGFGPLTGKYMIQAGAWSFIIILLPVYRLFSKQEMSLYLHWFSIVLATSIAFILPVDNIHQIIMQKGLIANIYALCLVFMVAAPILASRFLAKAPISKKIAMHIIIVVIFGLLVLQIVLEG